jgi:HSP20 family molecular chaperone IbpA
MDLPIEHFERGGRCFVRAYLPDADPDRDIRLDLRGSALSVHLERRVDYPECASATHHVVAFDKVLSVPAGTSAADVAAEYGEGVLLVSWPRVPSAARHTFPLTRCELPVE